tara:strand:+ start:95 stop:241 length:147 start_codon:yes stop_codon:yes gene_type:complete
MIENLVAIKHPVEGIAYLFYIALILRWLAPTFWNNTLEKLLVKNIGNM